MRLSHLPKVVRLVVLTRRTHPYVRHIRSEEDMRVSTDCRRRPSTSLKRSANGWPPRPALRHTVHFHSPGLGGLPLSPV